MGKVIKFLVILCMLVILFIPASFSNAAASGPVLSHICVPEGSTEMIAEVVWPGAPSIPANAPGSLSATTGDQTFTIDLTFDRMTGPTAHWQGVVPSGYTGDFVINSGWVLDPSHTVQNLPMSFKFGAECVPTAVGLTSISARSQTTSPLMLIWVIVLTAFGLVLVKRH